MDWLQFFCYEGRELVEKSNVLSNGVKKVSIENGIPRFVGDFTYSQGNFSKLREKHATLQLDSVNGTNDRLNTLLERTKWPAEFFKDKTVLECGCGAGPDTEILLSLGAKVLSVDLAGLDIAKANIGDRDDSYFIQADIADLPLKRESFDIVFCHRVLQHTPDPEKTLNHILQFVKPDGAVFVHSYAKTLVQMCRWKYLLRPITRRLDPETLYRIIAWYAPFVFRLTNCLRKLPGGYYIEYFVIPFLNKRGLKKFAKLSDKEVIEYGIHDTFDALAPKYDRPMSARRMNEIAAPVLQRPYEIEKRYTVTLLRTKV